MPWRWGEEKKLQLQLLAESIVKANTVASDHLKSFTLKLLEEKYNEHTQDWTTLIPHRVEQIIIGATKLIEQDSKWMNTRNDAIDDERSYTIWRNNVTEQYENTKKNIQQMETHNLRNLIKLLSSGELFPKIKYTEAETVQKSKTKRAIPQVRLTAVPSVKLKARTLSSSELEEILKSSKK